MGQKLSKVDQTESKQVQTRMVIQEQHLGTAVQIEREQTGAQLSPDSQVVSDQMRNR